MIFQSAKISPESEYDIEKINHTSTKSELEKLTIKLEQESVNLAAQIDELTAEKNKQNVLINELIELKDILKLQLDQERTKVIGTINDLTVERQSHENTKCELENAKLPFWKKFGL